MAQVLLWADPDTSFDCATNLMALRAPRGYLKNIPEACCTLALLAFASTACAAPEVPAAQSPTSAPTAATVPTPTPAPTPTTTPTTTPTPMDPPTATAISTPAPATGPMPSVPAPSKVGQFHLGEFVPSYFAANICAQAGMTQGAARPCRSVQKRAMPKDRRGISQAEKSHSNISSKTG